jgi:hypothetical protein
MAEMEEREVRAMPSRAGRSTRYLPDSSAARCMASAALPPLPKNTTLPPCLNAQIMASAMASICRGSTAPITEADS